MYETFVRFHPKLGKSKLPEMEKIRRPKSIPAAVKWSATTAARGSYRCASLFLISSFQMGSLLARADFLRCCLFRQSARVHSLSHGEGGRAEKEALQT
jgi:hypothetical protein